MLGNGIVCRGCGSPNVKYDSARRFIVCSQCGREEVFTRATMNANAEVVLGKENALKFFKSGKYEDAFHYARGVLNLLEDSAPALFIMSFYEEFVALKMGYMARFFESIADVPLLFDELEELRDLILCVASKMLEFEKEIISLVTKNMQGEEDKEILLKFLDELLPYFIKKRGSADFFSKELVEMYNELAGYCGIPRTCFALLSSIESNPDSPYFSKAFYLKDKTRYFYMNYVMPIGEIIEAMNEEFSAEFKSKFLAVYRKKKCKFENDMND
ncbi:MAG: hypothetical protein Q4A41_01075 [Bacillota bacterium]|nr:hypothetical protein [Bacillota bacterium]